MALMWGRHLPGQVGAGQSSLRLSLSPQTGTTVCIGIGLGAQGSEARCPPSFDENLLPLLLNRWQECNHQEDERHGQQSSADRTLEKRGELAPGDDERPPEVLLHQPAEHETEKQRSWLEA